MKITLNINIVGKTWVEGTLKPPYIQASLILKDITRCIQHSTFVNCHE